ncbi:hypothetical protein V492_04054 [Pseudogymnoascus sp. VKM F-4246]|nr:hypothetical protein V492_04054 [Pseudogymnoascus sp. VKM F-4246]
MTGSLDTDTRVLIVGAGIGGLTLAAICRQANIPCIVLERSVKLSPQGAGISLAPNALGALDQLGLYPQIQEHGQRLNKMLAYYNETFWRALDFTGLEAKFGYPVYSIERHKFHWFLYEAAGGDECVRLDSTVVDVIDDAGSDRVVVKVVGGKQYTGDMVVGADGIRSVTRRILAENAGLSRINTIKFTGRVHMSGYTKPLPNLGRQDLGVGSWMFYDDSVLTSWPCIDNRQWYIGVKRVPPGEKDPDRSVWEGATKDTVSGVYGEKFHPYTENKMVEDLINKSERVIASNVFEEKDFPSMTSGRVALLGDGNYQTFASENSCLQSVLTAAHSMTSFFGQGACQAIEDATELGDALITYYSSLGTISLAEEFHKYSESRGKRGKDLVSFSSGYAGVHVARLPYGLGPLARRIVFTWLPMWVWFWGLEWLYGHQPRVKNLVKINWERRKVAMQPGKHV